MPTNADDLETYSGFRCRGTYLKPGENYLEHWKTLVASGIPLALWGCEQSIGNPPVSIFDRLTSHDRFEFLNQIPCLRQECHQLGHDYFGVFYEHPLYKPSIERSLKQPGES